MSIKILTAQQMREVDQFSIERLGIPAPVLMENAGRAVVEVMAEVFPALRAERIGVVCGKGNNGGDGFVVARHLLMRGIRPRVVVLADPALLQAEARRNYELLVHWGLIPSVARNETEWQTARIDLLSSTVIVDAILGTGIDRPVEGFLAHVISDISKVLSHAMVMAVDMPSGLPSDSCASCGPVLRAHHTVTFTAPKFGQIMPPGCDLIGKLHIAPIGTPSSVFEGSKENFLNLVDHRDLAPFFVSRKSDTHKGSYGHVLVVAGSRGKSGAAAMTGMSALRGGAGLVTVASAKSAQPEIARSCPALMTESLEEDTSGKITLSTATCVELGRIIEGKSVIAVGPGLGADSGTREFVHQLMRETGLIPLVIDADGLNAFSGDSNLLDGSARTLVLTPHPGEMAKLTGLATSEVQARRVEVAREFAMKRNVYLVLKGSRTLIAEPTGQVYVNPTGNPGMATAGSGDVLTGVIAAMLAQFPSEPVEKVVSAAVYWHGAAGDQVVRRCGELSLIATDLIDALSDAATTIKREQGTNG